MKTRSSANEQGIAHLGFVLLVLVVVAAGALAFARVHNVSKTVNSSAASATKAETNEPLADQEAAVNSADKKADQSQAQQDNNAQEVDENAAQ
jgi:Tfp pilus assembly protein PilX